MLRQHTLKVRLLKIFKHVTFKKFMCALHKGNSCNESEHFPTAYNLFQGEWSATRHDYALNFFL